MSTQYEVTFTGTGQLNGPVQINKTVVYDENIAISFQGPKRVEAIQSALALFYPGVEITPNRISVLVKKIEPEKEVKKEKVKKEKAIKESKKTTLDKKTKDIEVKATPLDDKPNNESHKEENKNSFKNLIINTGNSILSGINDNKAKKREKEELYYEKKQDLINIPNPSDKTEYLDQINMLLLKLKAEPWIKDDTLVNEYADLCFERLKQTVASLKILDSNIDCSAYEKKIRKLKWSRFFKKNFN